MLAFDVHAHLYDDAFSKDLGAVIERARAVVFGVLNAGEEASTNRAVLELAKRYPGFCFPALGWHPENIAADIAEIEQEFEFIAKARPIAISEVGLDGRAGQLEKQIKVLELAIGIAQELKVPLVLHSRGAASELARILIAGKPEKAVLHAWSGSPKQALRLAELGYAFSIGNSIAYSEQKKALAAALPIEAILLESDSPVLPPQPGQRNEPANIALTIQALARIKKVSEEEIVAATNGNLKEVFGLKIKS